MFGSPEGTTWEWQHQGTINFGRWVLAQHSISNCQDTLCKTLENPEHYEHIIVWPQFCVMKLCGSTLSRLKPFDPCNFGLHNRDPNVAGRYIPVVWFTLKQIPFWCPFGGANPNEMLTLLRAQVAQPGGMGKSIEASTWLQGWGPTSSSQRFVQRCTFDPPLRVRAVICDLIGRPYFLALGVWNLLNVYMHGWFYYMIVGGTAFYNAHDKVIAVNSM